MPKKAASVTFTATKVVLVGVRIERGEDSLFPLKGQVVLAKFTEWLVSEEIIPVRVLSNAYEDYVALFEEKDAVRVEEWLLKHKIQRRE